MRHLRALKSWRNCQLNLAHGTQNGKIKKKLKTTRWLYRAEWTQYCNVSRRFAIRAPAVDFLHSTMLSVTCLRLSDVSVICRVTHFQFPIQSAFFHIGRQAALEWKAWIGNVEATYCGVLQVIRNIGHRTLPKNWVGTFLVRNVQPRGMILNWF